MERALRDKKAICFFVLPALVWFVLIALVPVIQSGGYSFLDWDGVNEGKMIGLQNYVNLFSDKVFQSSLVNSLLLAGASVFIQLPLSLILALVLSNGVRGENIFRNVYFVPVIISGTVIANLWMKVSHPSYGLLNTALGALGLEGMQREWLGDTATALGAVFVPMVWQYIGYHMLLLYSAAKSISPEIYEAARVDGASKWQISTRITIPMIIPMLKACVNFAVIGSLKSFDMIYILTGGGPVNSTMVPSLMMYKGIFTTNQYGYASAIAIFIILECLAFTGVIQGIFGMLQRKKGA